MLEAKAGKQSASSAHRALDLAWGAGSVREQRQSPGGVVPHTARPSRGVRGNASPRRGSGLAPRGLLRPSASMREQRQSPGGVVPHTARPSRGVRGDASPRRGSGLAPRGLLRPSASCQARPSASVRGQRQSPGGVVPHTARHSRGVRGDASPQRGSGLTPTPNAGGICSWLQGKGASHVTPPR
jgi:hypothetical protein